MSAGALVGLTLLVIGDSHLADPNYLIGPLHDRLTQAGAEVHSIGVCGVHSTDWLTEKAGDCGRAERRGQGEAIRTVENAKTTPIKELIAQDKPNAVIVVMGDTIGSYKNPVFPQAWAYQQVSSLTKAIAETGTACYWVGPGWGSEGGKFGKTYSRVEVVNRFLKENAAPCTYVDSTLFSKPGEWKTIDGQHYLKSGYKKWAEAITNTIIPDLQTKTAR